MSLLSNEDYLRSIEDALAFQKGAGRRSSAAISSAELVFSAADACPTQLVVRNVAKLVEPIIERCSLRFALEKDRTTSSSLIHQVVGLVLQCLHETHALRSENESMRLELQQVGGASTLAELQRHVEDLQLQLECSQRAAQEAERFHLQVCEKFLEQLDEAKTRLEREQDHVTAVYKELDTIREKLSNALRTNNNLEEALKRASGRKEDQLLEEVAKTRVLRNRIAALESECASARMEAHRSVEQERAMMELLTINQSEMTARSHIIIDFAVACQSAALWQPVQRMAKQLHMMRIQLSVQGTT